MSTTLREVKISGRIYCIVGVKEISDMLSYCFRDEGISRKVSLYVKSDAVKSLSAALKHFTKLCVLDLQYTIISYPDMITLLCACEEHPTFVELR